MIEPMMTALQRISDPFESSARAELERYVRRIRRDNPRYEMPAKEARQFIEAEQHRLRTERFQLLIQPIMRLYPMMPHGGRSCVKHADGSLSEWTDHWSPEQDKTIAWIDQMIAYHRGECGLGPKAELPSLAELMEEYPLPRPAENP